MTHLFEKVRSMLGRRSDDGIDASPFYRRFRPRINPQIIDVCTVVSHRFRYVYFRVGKAANSTVVASLLLAEDGVLVTDLGALQPIKDHHWARPSSCSVRQLRALTENYFKFTFVRDPYTRVLAAYLDKIQRNELGKGDAVNTFLGRRAGEDVSFEQFIMYLEGGAIDGNTHWSRQVDLIPMPVSALDFVGKVETLGLDLQLVLTRIFEKQVAPCSVRMHATGATRDHPLWNASLRRRVYKLYEQDFLAFGYREADVCCPVARSIPVRENGRDREP